MPNPVTARSLPVINNFHSLQQYLATWRKSLNKGLQRPPAPQVPWNFSVTNARGGFTLAWASVRKADGYEIIRTDNGDFSGSAGSNLAVIPVKSGMETSFFDSVGGESVARYYRVRATSGTELAPQVTKGNPTGVINHTSIDANDTGTVPTTLYDGATKQSSQTKSGGFTLRGGTGRGGAGMGFRGIGGGAGIPAERLL